jgi:hypothetical protein
MLITAYVCSILYHILECTHTATLIYSFHFNNITFVTEFEQDVDHMDQHRFQR